MKTFLGIACGPGIGIATAERFAREGYRVILAARTAIKVEALAEALRVKGFAAEARTVDASDSGSVAALIAAVEADRGTIDVVHYNGASLRMTGLEGQPMDAINSDLALNVGGALATVKAVAPAMQQRGEGSILITGGGFAFFPSDDFLTLSIGKAGLRAMVLALEPKLRDSGVRLSTVHVCCTVQPDDAIAIADVFWNVHDQAAETWQPEVAYPAGALTFGA